jgi:sugar lactone lactonase YvrE
MKRLALSILVTTAVLSPSWAAEPTKLWEAGGFKNPESVLHDPATAAIYVSNVNGEPAQKDGNGFLSKLAPDGTVVALEWVKGLDSPTGLALAGGTLYAADVDRIVAVDVATGAITARHAAPGARFLNDLTADRQGRVYASDLPANTIWVLEDGKLSVLLHDDALDNPNGLLVEDERLVVAPWGKMAEDFSTKVPGHVKVVDLATRKVADLGDPTPVGNLDGLVPDGKGGYLVTDWIGGVLFRVAADGKAERLLTLKQGNADLGVVPGEGTILIPMMLEGLVVAYRVD